jgi:hypothetical protein
MIARLADKRGFTGVCACDGVEGIGWRPDEKGQPESRKRMLRVLAKVEGRQHIPEHIRLLVNRGKVMICPADFIPLDVEEWFTLLCHSKGPWIYSRYNLNR